MKFNVLYIDPPWSYDNKKTGGSMKSGASAKYPSMPLEKLYKLPISEVAERNAVLFLWATVPLLPEAITAISVFGFKYRTMLTWQKTGRLGLGFWFRGSTEHLLLGVRGKVKPFRLQQPNIITLPAERHSKKPDQFRQIINNATCNMPGASKLEIFARETSPNWTTIGNEIDGLDIDESIQRLIGQEMIQ